MQNNYHTDSVKSHQKFAYWREAICDSYVMLGCETSNQKSFSGSIRLRELDDMRYSFVTSEKLNVMRRKKDIAQAKDEFFLLSLQRTGTGFLTQRGRVTELKPNDFALYDSTETYELNFPAQYEQLVLQFPKKHLLGRIPDANMMVANRIPSDTDIGGFISHSLLNLINHAEKNHDKNLIHHIQVTILDLIALGLSSIKGNRDNFSQYNRSILTQAQSFIHLNLDDHELNRDKVAEFLGISVRSLSNIFYMAGTTISEYIRTARLEKIAHALSVQDFSKVSISELAFKWGFNSLQHFSKVFTDRYKISPRKYRKDKSISSL